jgi:ABC-2 type transport system permease protein
LGAVWWIRGSLSVSLWAFPLIVLLQAILVFGLGLFLSTLHVYLRDTAPLVAIAVMIAMWTTPLFYSLEQLSKTLRTVVLCNPLSHLIELYHYVFLGGGEWSSILMLHWIVVTLTALITFIVGYRIFTRSHVEFADVI